MDPTPDAADGSNPRRTSAQRAGDAAEAQVEAALTAAGWQLAGRRLRIGRAEIDLLAIEPGPPATLVAVEVRWRRSRAFGLPEETVDERKVGRLWAALAVVAERGRLPDGRPLARLPIRVDLVAVEPGGPGRPVRLRHHRAVGHRGARRAL